MIKTFSKLYINRVEIKLTTNLRFDKNFQFAEPELSLINAK